jgi:hypothetical protein
VSVGGEPEPAGGSLTDRQLELLRRMSRLAPAPCVFGGYAEDALLAGRVTRPHGDVDWLVPRRELEVRLAQARTLGFTQFATWGEAAPGVPFYLFAQNGDLRLDVGISDEVDGRTVIRVQRLAFDIGGKPAPAGYQVVLPGDTYEHPAAEVEGIATRVASPLALYQMRVGIASQGTFGELSNHHRERSRRLREAFFAGRSEADLEPAIERLAASP